MKILKKRKKNLKKYKTNKIREECGVFGIHDFNDASTITALGLHALQHRGQEGCGIVSFDGKNFHSEKRHGLVGDNFTNKEILKKLPGQSAIGHNRYSTTGETSLRNIQPFFADIYGGGISVAHNGNFTNALKLRDKLVKDGAIFRTTSDTETVVQLIARSKRSKMIDKVIDTLFQVQGGYALVMMSNKKLIGARDPLGIRPLVLGKLKDAFVLASETCAFDIIGAKFIREVDNGEVVIIRNMGQIFINKEKLYNYPLTPCLFEYIYFARPESYINDILVYEYREKIAEKIVEIINKSDININNLYNVDCVIPVPQTGLISGMRIGELLNKPIKNAIIKNRYIYRTFIDKDKDSICKGIKKIKIIKKLVDGKNILVVDDSIVRGNTSYHIIEELKNAGANKIYFVSCCAPIRFPNKYGISIPTKEELIANNKNVEQIKNQLKVDDLIYLDIDTLCDTLKELNPLIKDFEKSVFTGEYIT